MFSDATFVINSTPLEYQTQPYYNIQQALGTFITQSKVATGNTNCDLIIDGHPYDIKNTALDRVNLSHVLCWTHEKFNLKFESHLKNMLNCIHNEMKNNETPNIKFFQRRTRSYKVLY